MSDDIEWAKNLALIRGGMCLEDKYLNNNNKMRWQCEFGHVWSAVATSVQQGHWCPVCVGKSKHDLNWLKNLAHERKGTCLSAEYINNHTKVKWMCAEGHSWSATPHSIQGGTWCSKCAGNAKHNFLWLTELAISNEGYCLSTEYKNSKTPVEWLCKEGHKWQATSNSVSMGRWCPMCAGNTKHDLTWLKELAKNKNGYCFATGYININTKVKWMCDKNHIWEATSSSVSDGHWCHICGGTSKKDLVWLVELASRKKGKCLATEYLGSKIDVEWECENGHRWKARPNNIQQGSWCPACRYKKI